MKFPDKDERYSSGEPTDRFVVYAETRAEHDVMRRALYNVIYTAASSEAELDEEDVRVTLDYLMQSNHSQPRYPVSIDEAARLAKLVRQGAATLEDEQTLRALELAEQIEQEIPPRIMRIELRNFEF